jgi:uncharacterized protein YkwD
MMKRMRSIPAVLMAMVLILLAAATTAHAGPWKRWRRAAACGVQPQPQYQAAAVQMVPVAGTVAAAMQPGGDASPGGFLAWLNATRAAYGLPSVAYSADVEASCHQNNLMQAARGMDHHFMGCHRRQNVAAGLGFPGVEAAWLNSPGHASALLDPTIRHVGIAWYGMYCTFGAN